MNRSAGALVTALALAVGASPALAVSPVAKLRGNVSLTRTSPRGDRVKTPARFHVGVSFGTDTPGAQLFTIQNATIFFPDHAGTNGRLFRSCDAATIASHHGDLTRCPRGSLIGRGKLSAQVLGLNVAALGNVTLFNSHNGKDVTFNFETTQPADIDQSIDAPLTQLHGMYGERLVLVVPHSLQEVIPNVFVGIQSLNVTISGSTHVRGIEYSYLRADACPGRAMHGIFGFEDFTTGQVASTTADTDVRCTGG